MYKLRHHTGFTLLEVLVAITILSIGILGVAGLTAGVMRGNYLSKNVTTATIIAQNQLEDIRRAGYVNATTANFPNANVPMGGVTFAGTTTIVVAANMKTVTVAVSWDNNAHSVTLVTILAQ